MILGPVALVSLVILVLWTTNRTGGRRWLDGPYYILFVTLAVSVLLGGLSYLFGG